MPYRVGRGGSVYRVKKGGKSRKKTYRTKRGAKLAAHRRYHKRH